MSKKDVERLAKELGGTVKEVSGPLPDGSGFATISLPLPSNHWLTRPGFNEPPMPFRCGLGDTRTRMAQDITEAARYAIRASTMNGQENDFDPDAMIQNMIVGMLGYWTIDGFSHL